MASPQAVFTRRSAAQPLRCYVADWPARPGDVAVDPAGQRVQVVATAEQLLRPAPPPEGRVTAAPPASATPLSASRALDLVPPAPFLTSIVATPHGSARMLRLRARSRTAVLALADGAQIELPLAALRAVDSGPSGNGAAPC